MSQYISYCTVDCRECPVYIASKNNDEILKIKTAEEWGRLYKKNFTPADIKCGSCKSGSLFILCSSCTLKSCCKDKKIENCKDCSIFPCEKLQKFNSWIDKQEQIVLK